MAARADRAAGRPEPHRRRVTREDQGASAPVRVHDEDGEAREGEVLDLGAEELVEHPEDGDVVEAGEGQGAPGAAEAGRQGGGVGAVAHDVAHEHGAPAIVVLDRVVEVAAELGPAPAGLVPTITLMSVDRITGVGVRARSRRAFSARCRSARTSSRLSCAARCRSIA
jgi:hypothetical protein